MAWKLGKEVDVTDDLLKALKKFVCFPKDGDVNAVRRAIIWNKFKKKNQVIELSLLPPCRENLRFYVMRTNRLYS